MKAEDIRKMSDEEIMNEITKTKKELFDLRLKQSTGNLEKPSTIRNLRKNIARMKTILKERKIGGAK